MGWMGDVAVLGALAVAGYWFLNNYKSLGIGGGGGSTTLPPVEGDVPPLETAPTTPTGRTNLAGETVDERTDVRASFPGLSPLDDCVSASFTNSTTKSCTCVKAGAETAVVCENKDGIKCTQSKCGTNFSAANRKKWKVEKCGCTFPEAAKQYASSLALAYAYNTRFEYAHGFPRLRLSRSIDSDSGGN